MLFRSKIILEEKSFRNYIIGLLDIEYMDTYEYAAMVLWGSVYLIDLMKKRGQMTAEDADKSLEIIRKIKAFIMINIPWDGYWKLKFIHDWVRPLSVTEEEFNSERKLCLNNFAIKPDEIINHSIKDLFNDYMNDISYARYL